jgi:single-stranded DNA-binding protein
MLNSIAIQGRLVYTPEAKVTKSGKDVCTFSIACDRQSGGQKENISKHRYCALTFLDCIATSYRKDC